MLDGVQQDNVHRLDGSGDGTVEVLSPVAGGLEDSELEHGVSDAAVLGVWRVADVVEEAALGGREPELLDDIMSCFRWWFGVSFGVFHEHVCSGTRPAEERKNKTETQQFNYKSRNCHTCTWNKTWQQQNCEKYTIFMHKN